MGKANPKATIYTHTQKIKQPKHNIKMVIKPQENKRRKNTYKIKPKTIKKRAIGIHISNITLNVNGLNAPTKRHRLAKWIQKTRPIYMLSTRDPPQSRDTHKLKVRGWKNIFHANGNRKKGGEAILISDKIDFKINTVGTSWWSSG